MRVLVAFAALVVVCSAAPSVGQSSYVVHDKRSNVPHLWSKRDRVDTDVVIPVRIGLQQQNLHRAEEFIDEISQPLSGKYGQHWSPEKVAETFAPTKASVKAVKEWLHHEGVEPARIAVSKSRSWLTFEATIQEVERLLKTEYHTYSHLSGHSHIACDSYSIPAHLRQHIDIITPTIDFDQKIGHGREQKYQRIPDKALRKRQPSPNNGLVGGPQDFSNPKQGDAVTNVLMTLGMCDTMITPDCLRALYDAPAGKRASSSNSLGIVEYTPEAFLQSDLNIFMEEFQPSLVGQGPKEVLIDGAVVQTTNQSFAFNGESALDLQYGMALVAPQTTTLFQVGDLTTGGSFNNFLDALDASYCTFEGGDSKNPGIDGQYPNEDCGTFKPTNVISTSYSSNEADLSAKYEQRQCLEYLKLGLQGVSILYSSGDFGVAGNGNTCIDPATGAYNNGSSGIFNPSFPGSCPYITSVGATQINVGSSVQAPESAAETVIFSGGGFSNVFAIPNYQQKAMAKYFSSSPPPYGADRFNNSQKVRGFPDVSANGVNYVTAVDGTFSLTYGTSASCPTFASMLNLINEERIAAKKGPVGFVNPVLYANPDVLNDITKGGNQGCGTAGFSAVKGWDPVTGLGTPNYPAMLNLFMSLP